MATIANGKICYLVIPTADIPRSVRFYQAVFGWPVRQRPDGSMAFNDGAGEVSGTWVEGRPATGEPGLFLYVMVDNIAAACDGVVANGGRIVKAVDPAAREITAHFADPDGNILGLYEHAGSA